MKRELAANDDEVAVRNIDSGLKKNKWQKEWLTEEDFPCATLSVTLTGSRFNQVLPEASRNYDIPQQLLMCWKTATYTLKHRVADAMTDDLFVKLQTRHFFVSVEKSTNKANNKVVNAFVKYLDEIRGEVVTQLLRRFKTNVANA
ncbi:hypothetical protein PoB_001973500 [Plakobranchus ocellatus]|uniref:Uncharacterized protein n=1 Tax=Plakobranchus ocellatus TaxID=259542 RepID=A0AAV3ZCC3_9GAST|nr:hypothetical protein PoB_001973500 [Plakobranchus ocellatus]